MEKEKENYPGSPAGEPQSAKDNGSRPIKATWPRRTATLLAVALLKRVRRHFSDVLFLTPSLCVKYGERINLAEAATLVYIKRHTSIPVPNVYCAFEHGGKTYIVMQRLAGRKLASGWRERSQESRGRILEQLRGMVEEMRALESPLGDARVANVDGGRLADPRLRGLGFSSRFGPFEDIWSFHRWLRRPAIEVEESYYPDLKELISMHEETAWGRTVLTHGDLSSLNILVKGDEVTGIVDWEVAGWYPAYWEYTTAMQVNFKNEFWGEYVGGFLEPRPEELRMEGIRQKYFGGP